MARAGLGEGWDCLLANDLDAKKCATYAANWGPESLRIGDVGNLTTADLPGRADLVWASFPCQDLSLAGDYAGLSGKRSRAFWLFWRLIEGLLKEQRPPAVVVLENVRGALTSHDGRDFAAIGAALVDAGYRFGAIVMDAARFVPQSRPRLFIVAVRQDRAISESLVINRPDILWHPANLVAAYSKLPHSLQQAWLWWNLPSPPPRQSAFADIVGDHPQGVEWHAAAETRRLLSMMSPVNRRKVEQAASTAKRMVGGVYKRTRVNQAGQREQRAEIRFDEIAGCLRTPAGGSSRQSILLVEGDKFRSRLLAPREAAILMGLPDSYKLPGNYNEAYHLIGDGVVVPVVRYLAAYVLEPLLGAVGGREKEAA